MDSEPETIPEPQPVSTPPKPAKKPRADRLTVQLTVYHESLGFPSQSASGNFQRLLETKEQAYTRRITLDKESGWTRLDHGPISEGVGYVLIENKVGRARQANPSSEELEAEAKQHIEVSFGGNEPQLVVRAGSCALFELLGDNDILLRSVSGIIPAITTCYPR